MPTLRLLVACPRCARQYDASERTVGSRFRCSCGEILTVPEPKPHAAAVVRCSSCGAPRQGAAAVCSFCGADFTLHEQDLDTLCPGCMARVSGRARFCHYCATPLVAEEAAGRHTERPCPVCGPESHLVSRRLGEESLAALECGRCAGLWIGKEAFELLAERARSRQLSIHGHGAPASTAPEQRQGGPLYRPCPLCGALMNRRNYGRRSGVIIDLCSEHGVWFDAQELDRILRWIKSGGPQKVAQQEMEELAERRREAARPAITQPTLGHYDGARPNPAWGLMDFLVDAVGWLGRNVR